uniref:Interleukin-12 subunit alpha n=1 Tax=Tetraodon nigroviridis TaxID=99883 RepID=H3C7F8_TETNG
FTTLHLHSYLSSAALLLMFTCPLWQLSQALPLTDGGPVSDQCVLQAQMFLRNITETLSKKELFSGIDCTKQSMEFNRESQTATVCTPKGLTCSGTTQSEFNKISCLKNIREDLHYYYSFLSAQPDADRLLHTTVLASLRELMQQKCFVWEFRKLEEKNVAGNHQSSYDERLKLCIVLRGFQVRIVTINRAVQYMNAGEDAQ